MQVKNKQLEQDVEQQTGSNLKGVHQGSILSPCLFTFYAKSWKMPGWMKHKLESRLLGKISINNLRYADGTTLMAESEEELRRFLMKLKEEKEKAGLKLSILKTKIMKNK